MITVSSSARQYIKNLCAAHQKSGIRMTVKGGGCSGFQLNFDFYREPEPLDFTVDIDQYVFAVDNASLLFVAGSELDLESSIMGQNLKLVNPNQKSQCGCGKSFAL